MSYASIKTLRPFFTNKCGRLLAGGKVYTYEVGTLTPKATYKDAAGLTENTNPIALDVSGEADIFINSDYRFQIFDKDGVLIDDVDSVAPTQRISSAFLIDESGFNQAQINATKEDTLNKGVAGGYASLDENTKVPDAQLSVVNNLTTSDTAKPLSAAMGKKLQDEKLNANNRGYANGVASLDENTRVPVTQLPLATSLIPGVMKITDGLVVGGSDTALSAEAMKNFYNIFSAVKAANGRIRLPCVDGAPLLLQWVTSPSIPTGTSGVAYWPVAFPNACLTAFSSPIGNATNVSGSYIAAGGVSVSAVDLYNWGPITAATRVFAIGY